MHRYVLLSMALLLGACDQTSSDPAPPAMTAETQAETAKPEWPAFPLHRQEATSAISEIDPIWADFLPATTRDDSFSGGESTSLMNSNASAYIFTRGDGMVWRVRLNNGMGDRCAKKIEAAAVVKKFIRIFEPSVPDVDVIHGAGVLSKGLGHDEISDPVQIGKTTFAAGGKCMQSIVATAGEPGAIERAKSS